MRHNNKFFILIPAMLINLGMLLGSVNVTHAAQAQYWWQEQVPPPGPNQIINPEYIRIREELRQTWNQVRRQSNDKKQYNRWVRRTYPKAINNSRALEYAKTLEKQLKATPVYLTVAPETDVAQTGADAGTGTAGAGAGAAVAGTVDIIPKGSCTPVADATEAMTKFIINTILFDLNSSILRPQDAAVLQEAANELKENPETSVVIVGHACDLGTEAYNLWLSKKRAATARNFLMNQGIEESRLKADGVGEGCPVADNTTPGGRERNRRVEFFVSE